MCNSRYLYTLSEARGISIVGFITLDNMDFSYIFALGLIINDAPVSVIQMGG